MAHNTRIDKRRKKKTSAKGTLIFGGVLVVLAIIFLITAGGSTYKSSAKNQEMIEQNVKTLKELEEQTPAAQPQGDTPPSGVEELSGEEEKILNLSPGDYDVAKGKSWFQGTVFLGDSVVEAAAEFDYLSREVDLAVIGASLLTCDEQIEGAIARYPSAIFLCFGANDFEIYQDDYDSYVKKLKERLDQLKAALPDVVIYVEAPFPVQEEFRASSLGSEYQPGYVDAVREFCETEENVYYIDATFILDQMPELYEPDGIHPVAAFYPKWLTYLADVTGRSKTGDE